MIHKKEKRHIHGHSQALALHEKRKTGVGTKQPSADSWYPNAEQSCRTPVGILRRGDRPEDFWEKILSGDSAMRNTLDFGCPTNRQTALFPVGDSHRNDAKSFSKLGL